MAHHLRIMAKGTDAHETGARKLATARAFPGNTVKRSLRVVTFLPITLVRMFQRHVQRSKKVLRKLSGLGCLEDLTVEQRRAMWPPAKPLQDEHLRNCRLIANRDVMLELMPKHATCAEIGIWRCEYSAKILNITQPEKLHLVDIDPTSIEWAREKFSQEIARGEVMVHLGDSPGVIKSMPGDYFDWIYVDGDHSYEGVKRDLEAARMKLKPDGLLAMNDYIYFESSGFSKYGVVEAVNEFCINHDFELLYFALHGRMYSDVVLRSM